MSGNFFGNQQQLEYLPI